MREERAMAHEADHPRRSELVEHCIEGTLIAVIEGRREEQLVDCVLELGIGRPREQTGAELNDVGESACRRPGRHADDGQRIGRLAQCALDERPSRQAALVDEGEEDDRWLRRAQLLANRSAITCRIVPYRPTPSRNVLATGAVPKHASITTCSERSTVDIGYSVGKLALGQVRKRCYRSYWPTIPLRWFH